MKRSIIILLLLSFLSALYGLGESYNSFITPTTSRGEFRNVSADGWIAEGSEITFHKLLSRGNRLILNFKDWKEAPFKTAQIKASVCGEPVSEFQASWGGEHVIYLKGDCEPRELSFSVENPFIPSETDQRKLGIQIENVRLTSRAGVPVLEPYLFFGVLGTVFLISLLVFLNFQKLSLGWLSLPVPFLAYWLLSEADFYDLRAEKILAFFIAALLAGAFFTEAVKERGQDVRLKAFSFGTVFPLLIIIAAAFLRYSGIDFGLPANYHPDEVPKYNAIMRMVQHGDLNPRYFLHPSLLLYSTYFSNEILHALGVFTGTWEESLLLAGRCMSALAGTLSVLFTILIGRRLFSPVAGLIGGLILAVSPLHIACSRYVKEDSLLVFFILATVFVVLKAVQDKKKRLLLLAGILAGCSASVKYSGILSFVIVASAPWLSSKTFFPDKRFIPLTLLALLFMPLGFVLCSPYTVLDYGTFIKDFSYERRHMSKGHSITIDAWSQLWMYHIRSSIIPGMQWMAAFISFCGLGMLIKRWKMLGLFLLGLFLLYYLPAEFVKAKPAPQPERYILPCIPFLALAAGYFISSFRKSFVVVVLCLMVVIIPGVRSWQLAGEVKNDTRDRMDTWLRDNLKEEALLYVDWQAYAPPLQDVKFSVEYLDQKNVIGQLDVSRLKGAGDRYLLLSSLYYDRFFSQPGASIIARERVRGIFAELEQVKDVTPVYGTYGFHNPRLTLFRIPNS